MSSFPAVGRRPLSARDLVELGPPGLPRLVRALAPGLSAAEWAAANRARVDSLLMEHGALLFRDFRVEDTGDFAVLARALSRRLIAYGERSSPRTRVADGVYTSTDHPPHQPIVLHNEQSYTLDWPLRLFFWCRRPAPEGGATPLADSRRLLSRLDPALVRQFVARGVRYQRCYNGGLGLTWQQAFQTDARADVEAHCRRESIDWQWLDGGRLRTWQVRPAVRRHPAGADVWFNHALFFHVSSLEPALRDAMLQLPEDELPTHTTWGDGAPFAPDVLRALREALDAETVRFVWRRGDVLVADNMLTAHGRDPFVPPREVLVAMADPFREAQA
jgi:alpha-ketoglutarate-dependent taurine dioxygenase